MIDYYDNYKKTASLVITSLLHCAVPCLAAGIPIILARKEISYRFGWLESLTPIYDKKNFENIEWNPLPVNYENHKKQILALSIDRIQQTRDKYMKYTDVSIIYESRVRNTYVNELEPIKDQIDKVFMSEVLMISTMHFGASLKSQN